MGSKNIVGRLFKNILIVSMSITLAFVVMVQKIDCEYHFMALKDNVKVAKRIGLKSNVRTHFKSVRGDVDKFIEGNINAFRYEKISLKSNVSNGVNKSYMDLRTITDKSSKQYKLKSKYQLDSKGHYYYEYQNEKFYSVALGSYFGDVGDLFYVELSNGNSFYCIKGDEKADCDTIDNYAHIGDKSVIEFIVNEKIAKNYYGASNGYACNGNFNNNEMWRGKIKSISKISIAN